MAEEQLKQLQKHLKAGLFARRLNVAQGYIFVACDVFQEITEDYQMQILNLKMKGRG